MDAPFSKSPAWVRISLGIWAPMLLVVCAFLLSSHLLTLPSPEVEDPALQAAVVKVRKQEDTGKWMAIHVLYADCKCSQGVAKYLVSSKRPEGVAEKLILVGEDAAMAEQAAAMGFEVIQTTPEGLSEDWHMQAAPLLVLVDPANQLQYLGGYTDRKQAADIRDVAILSSLQQTKSVPALPLFGCAVSQSLQRAVDPFGLR